MKIVNAVKNYSINEECTENIKETKLNETLAKNEHKCSSCTLCYIVLF